MKKLLILPVLLLASCAPILQTVQKESASLKVDVGAVIFANPGPDAALAPALLLNAGAETADPNCAKRASGRVGCTLPDVGVGQQYRLIYTGKVTGASVTFYRDSSGERPIYLRLN